MTGWLPDNCKTINEALARAALEWHNRSSKSSWDAAKLGGEERAALSALGKSQRAHCERLLAHLARRSKPLSDARYHDVSFYISPGSIPRIGDHYRIVEYFAIDDMHFGGGIYAHLEREAREGEEET